MLCVQMDKAHVLREAINYVKQLQERVEELEEDIQKNGVEQSRKKQNQEWDEFCERKKWQIFKGNMHHFQ